MISVTKKFKYLICFEKTYSVIEPVFTALDPPCKSAFMVATSGSKAASVCYPIIFFHDKDAINFFFKISIAVSNFIKNCDRKKFISCFKFVFIQSCSVNFFSQRSSP